MSPAAKPEEEMQGRLQDRVGRPIDERKHPAPARPLVVELERHHWASYPFGGSPLRSAPVELRRTLGGALAGSIAAGAWAAQQPLDKRVFGSRYDDLEILGKAVTRGPAWPAVGLAIHMTYGAIFGATYALARPFIPGPPQVAALVAAMAEQGATWPLVPLVDSGHPARSELEKLSGNRRALAQATWRHFLFGLVLGELERRLNPADEFEPPAEVPVSSNGHGDLEQATAGAAQA
jgi:hypothetical protein